MILGKQTLESYFRKNTEIVFEIPENFYNISNRNHRDFILVTCTIYKACIKKNSVKHESTIHILFYISKPNLGVIEQLMSYVKKTIIENCLNLFPVETF